MPIGASPFESLRGDILEAARATRRRRVSLPRRKERAHYIRLNPLISRSVHLLIGDEDRLAELNVMIDDCWQRKHALPSGAASPQDKAITGR